MRTRMSFRRYFSRFVFVYIKSISVVKRRRLNTLDVYPADEKHPEHITRIKHLLFQASNDEEQDAILTAIDPLHVVASYHCFKSYLDGEKLLTIRSMFELDKAFTVRAVKSCNASTCKVILFESEARLFAENKRAPTINLPLWGREYYVLVSISLFC